MYCELFDIIKVVLNSIVSRVKIIFPHYRKLQFLL